MIMTANNKLLLSILGGLAAGATAGLLIAPGSGRQTIDEVTRQARGWRRNLERRLDQWRASRLESRRDEFLSAAYNDPANLPHRPRITDMGHEL